MNINNPTTFSAPDLTFTTSNSSGTAGALRANDSILIYDTTLPDAITYGQSGSAGNTATASRRNHAHAMAASDQVVAASQAEMEAASSTSVYASPGRTQFHPGVAKAWCQLTAAGALVGDGHNIAGVDELGTGQRRVNWATDFSDTNYAATPVLGNNDNFIAAARFSSLAVGSCQILIYNATPALADEQNAIAAFGDQ